MDIKELKEKILSTGYSEDKKMGMYFHMKYPELYRELIDKTKYYFADFVMNNKIIEYDGLYWHNETDDYTRNASYNKIGFDVLTINENEFNRDRKNSETIEKCLKFLRNEI